MTEKKNKNAKMLELQKLTINHAIND